MNTPPLPCPFDLSRYLDEKRRDIHQALSNIILGHFDNSRVCRAMTYSLMAGGKRLRPVLCLAAAETVGGPREEVMTAACAIEMLHTYSLIHDDLPAMDNDTLRRGNPTCHIQFDEATAILAGDGLLTFAFELLALAGEKSMDPAPWTRVIADIARAAGHRGMIEGQMRDIQAESGLLDLEGLKSMHGLKTGALIRAAVKTGAILGGGSADAVQRLDDYARHVGLAFQVVDDILNVSGDTETLGKAVGTDALRGKSTYPGLMGLEKSREFALLLVNNALQALDGFDNKAAALAALAHYIVERKS